MRAILYIFLHISSAIVFDTYVGNKNKESEKALESGVEQGLPAAGAAHAPNAPRGIPGARVLGGGPPGPSISASQAPDAASAAATFAAVVDILSAAPPEKRLRI